MDSDFKDFSTFWALADVVGIVVIDVKSAVGVAREEEDAEEFFWS